MKTSNFYVLDTTAYKTLMKHGKDTVRRETLEFCVNRHKYFKDSGPTQWKKGTTWNSLRPTMYNNSYNLYFRIYNQERESVDQSQEAGGGGFLKQDMEISFTEIISISSWGKCTGHMKDI